MLAFVINNQKRNFNIVHNIKQTTEDEKITHKRDMIKLIESDYFENFVHSVADETFTIDNVKQIEKLIDE